MTAPPYWKTAFMKGGSDLLLTLLLAVLPFLAPDTTRLPPPDTSGGMSLNRALYVRRSNRDFDPLDSLTAGQLSQLLWSVQGKTGARGGRTAPSAGATYPLMLLCAVERVRDVPPGLYLYEPVEHALIGLYRSSGLVAGLADECFRQRWIAPAPVMLIITADYPRTTDHYGEIGVRFVDMEAGHAGQNLYLQAAALGLSTCAVGVFSEEGVRNILGDGAGTPLYLFPVGPPEY